MPSKEFQPAEFAATLERIRGGRDAASENPKPAFDPYQAREVREAAMGGRRPESYEQALLYHGFFFVPAGKLLALPGAAISNEGMWYHRGMRMAFTPTSLATDFPLGPEEFDTFMREQKLLRRQSDARALGLYPHR